MSYISWLNSQDKEEYIQNKKEAFGGNFGEYLITITQDCAIQRREAYPSLEEQADMQYWDAVNGTTTWQDAIQAVKDAHPKPI